MLDGLDLGAPISPRLSGADSRETVLSLLSGSPYPEDRDAAFERFSELPFEVKATGYSNRGVVDQRRAALGFAQQRDPRGDSTLTAALTRIAESGAPAGHDDDLEWLLVAVCKRAESPEAARWSQLLGRCLHRGPGVHLTLALLAPRVDPAEGPIDALRAWLSQRVDAHPKTRAMRAAAHAALAAWGQPAPLEDARWVREHLLPVRYGWPKHDSVALMRRLCAELFLRVGGEADHRWVAEMASAEDPILHAAGDRARALLGLPAIERTLVDEPLIDRRCEAGDLDGLFDLLERPGTVGLDQVVKGITRLLGDEGEHDAHVDQLVAWAKARLEGQPNFPLTYSDDVPPGSVYAMRFLERLGEDRRGALEGTSSLWIRKYCLGEEVSFPTASAPLSGGVALRRLDDDPFNIGKHVNGLAISPGGDLLCAVGDGGARLLDAATGAWRHQLDANGWAYDCAFHPNGEEVVVCFHGGHVIFFDVETGARTRSLSGHPGVPHGVRCLAFDEGATRLLTGDDGGHLICWSVATGEIEWRHEVKGGFSDVLFLPDGRAVASYDGPKPRRGNPRHYLLIIDADGQPSKPVKTPNTAWGMALSADGRLALGGAHGDLSVGQLKGKRYVEALQAPVTDISRLQWIGDRLWATTVNGKLVTVDLGELTKEAPEPQEIASPGAALWALAHHGGVTYAAGKAGQIILCEGLDPRPVPLTHGRRVIGIVELPGGDVISADWDGLVLRWPGGQGPATQIVVLGQTCEDIAVLDEGHLLCGTRSGLRLVSLDSGEIVARTEEGSGPLTLVGDQVAYSLKRGMAFATLPDLGEGGPAVEMRSEAADLAGLPSGDGLLLSTAHGGVGIWSGGQWRWRRLGHGYDRLERGNPHKDVCSVATFPQGDLVATGATDGTARVFDAATGEQVLRIQCGFGLFNRLSVCPEGRLLALPAGRSLEVYDVRARRHAWTQGWQSMGGQTLSVCHFGADGRLLVGMDSGGVAEIVTASAQDKA